MAKFSERFIHHGGERERKIKVRRKSGKLVERQDPSFHKYRLKISQDMSKKCHFDGWLNGCLSNKVNKKDISILVD